jgi:hypothetical protein
MNPQSFCICGRDGVAFFFDGFYMILFGDTRGNETWIVKVRRLICGLDRRVIISCTDMEILVGAEEWFRRQCHGHLESIQNDDVYFGTSLSVLINLYGVVCGAIVLRHWMPTLVAFGAIEP